MRVIFKRFQPRKSLGVPLVLQRVKTNLLVHSMAILILALNQLIWNLIQKFSYLNIFTLFMKLNRQVYQHFILGIDKESHGF